MAFRRFCGVQRCVKQSSRSPRRVRLISTPHHSHRSIDVCVSEPGENRLIKSISAASRSIRFRKTFSLPAIRSLFCFFICELDESHFKAGGKESVKKTSIVRRMKVSTSRASLPDVLERQKRGRETTPSWVFFFGFLLAVLKTALRPAHWTEHWRQL